MGTRIAKTALLALVIAGTLVALGVSASANEILWVQNEGDGPTGKTSHSDHPLEHCNFVPSGSIYTTETTTSQQAAYQAYLQIFPTFIEGESYPGGQLKFDESPCVSGLNVWRQYDDEGTARYIRRVYLNGEWTCRAGLSEGDCCKEHIWGKGYWSICGDGTIQTNTEKCDPPATNSGQCSQTTSQCFTPKLGTRDDKGDCNSVCQCVQDSFTYTCVNGQCGATCSSNPNDCSPDTCSQEHTEICDGKKLKDYNNNGVKDTIIVTNSVPNTCIDTTCACTANLADCSPPAVSAHCVKNACLAACSTNADCPNKCIGTIRYYSGACDTASTCLCSYQTEDCGTGSTCTPEACVSRPALLLSAGLYPTPNIKIGEKANLSVTVKCVNANCGDVRFLLKNISATETPLSPTTNPYIEGPNPYLLCGNMIHGSLCSTQWNISGLVGTYNIRVIATNGSSLNNFSILTLNIADFPVGSLSAELLGQSLITKGSSATFTANVSCSAGAVLSPDAACGNLTLNLGYNMSLGLSISGNPRKCPELKANQICQVEWTIAGTEVGAYNLTAKINSDKKGVANISASKIIAVTEKTVGMLSFKSTFLNPPEIEVGRASNLDSDVICSSSDGKTVSCGRVYAYPRQNGMRINSSGLLTIPTPEEINCGVMDSDSNNACHVYWSIKGNSKGSYPIDIYAYSESPDVQSRTSEKKTLDVTAGKLSITRVELTPSQIKIINSTSFSAAINCSAIYCGNVNVQVSAKGVLLAYNTPVSTVSQNPQPCPSFPCSLNWALTGNQEGSYSINVIANSNESMQASDSSKTLVVVGNSPLLSLSEVIIPKEAFAGQPTRILATVSCFAKDCGTVSLGLSYRTASGWKTIASSGDVYLSQPAQNPLVLTNLLNQPPKQMIWEVNFTKAGAYEISILASGSTPNTINAEQKGVLNAVLSGKPKMEILMPLANESVFFLGDMVVMKARILIGGTPLKGLLPVTATIPELFTTTLYDDGKHSDDFADDGIYGGMAAVPGVKIAGGQYRLIFRSGESETWIPIYINPELYVTIRTDKSSYSWGQNIIMSGEVRKRGIGTPATIAMDVVLIQGNWSDEISFNATGQYSYSYDNKFMPSTGGDLILKATAKDEYQNMGYNSTTVSVSPVGGDYYTISFSMSKRNYTRGQTMAVLANVYEADAIKTGVKVNCRFLGKEIELKEVGTGHSGYYNIPTTAPMGDHSLSCSAEGPKPGSGQAKIRIEPIPLKIVIVKPQLSDQNVISVVSGQSIEIRAAVMYPDNNPVTDASIQINIGNKTANMTYAGTPGFYKTDTIFSGAGIAELILQAQDPQGNQGKSNVSLVVDKGEFNWWWLLLVPAGIVLFLFGWRLYLLSKREPPRIQIQEKIIRVPVRERVREVVYKPMPISPPSKPRISPSVKLKNEIKDLEEKHKTIQSAKELAEQQYYKRQIDEATFNKLMQDYEERLIEIDASIRQKKHDLQMLSG